MKTETIEEFLKRGGKIKKATFDESWKKISDTRFRFPKKAKKKN